MATISSKCIRKAERRVRKADLLALGDEDEGIADEAGYPGHADYLAAVAAKLGRRVFRRLGGNMKQVHNKPSYTGGGVKVGAKPYHLDSVHPKLLRQQALE